MDFLSEFLPIVIYILLIALIIVGIVLGVKLIITIDKAQRVIDDAKNKIDSFNGFFNILENTSGKIYYVYEKISDAFAKVVNKVFSRNKDKNIERNDD